jgi:phosphate starvation-inducible protein PhoH
MNREIKNKIDDALFNFYLEADKETIKDSLIENIRDIEEYEKNKKKFLFLAKATATKKHNESLLLLVSKFQDALLMNIEKPIAILKQLVQGNPSFALYKNFDKISKENIIEIIKDRNFVELFEKLEEDEKKH